MDTLTSDSDDQTECDRRVNEGVVDVVLRTGCKVTSTTITETAGTGDYTLDTEILKVVGWDWSNATDTLIPERVSVEELLWRRRTVVDTAYPASAYAFAGANLLMVYPTPVGADTITVYYVPRPATLSTGSDSPDEIPAEHHIAVEMYALWRLASANDDQSSGQGERYRILYEGQDGDGGMLARVRRQVNRKGGRHGKATLNPSRRLRKPTYVFNDTRF